MDPTGMKLRTRDRGVVSEDREAGANVGIGYWIYEPNDKSQPPMISAYESTNADARRDALRDLMSAVGNAP